MTALLPTTGHINLLQFASNIADEVRLIVSYRSNEPMITERTNFWNNNDMGNVIPFHHKDDNAPQNPYPSLDYDYDFWAYWKNVVNNSVNGAEDQDFECIVASETYGKELANTLGIDFIPYDINRDYLQVKGSKVRENIGENFLQVAPSFRKYLKHSFVMFGQESVGKTTMAKELSEFDSDYRSAFLPEYARGYLENTTKDLDARKMRDILAGQLAIEKIAIEDLNHQVTYMDTDFRSTEGYYGIMKLGWNEDRVSGQYMANKTYFILPDDIPFEPDPLRYGGDVRESKTQLWISLAHHRNLDYIIVPNGTFEQKKEFIRNEVRRIMNAKLEPMETYVRD